jgi:hypothetical protein
MISNNLKDKLMDDEQVFARAHLQGCGVRMHATEKRREEDV